MNRIINKFEGFIHFILCVKGSFSHFDFNFSLDGPISQDPKNCVQSTLVVVDLLISFWTLSFYLYKLKHDLFVDYNKKFQLSEIQTTTIYMLSAIYYTKTSNCCCNICSNTILRPDVLVYFRLSISLQLILTQTFWLISRV